MQLSLARNTLFLVILGVIFPLLTYSQKSDDVILDSTVKLGVCDTLAIKYTTLRDCLSANQFNTAAYFNQGNIYNPLQLIEGKFAGLLMSKPGNNPMENFQLRLRGISSLTQGNTPLIVIDGLPMADLFGMDPFDIEKIRILRGASSSVIYGLRGSNGVIEITSKRGVQSPPKVEVEAFQSWESVSNSIEMLDFQTFIFEGGNNLGNNTNWIDEITRRAKSNGYRVSVFGDSKTTSYRASLNYRKVDGIIDTQGLKRLNARFSLNQSALNDKLNLGLSIVNSVEEANPIDTRVLRYALQYNPTAPIRSVLPEFERYDGYFQQSFFDYLNPVAFLNQSLQEEKRNLILMQLQGAFDLSDNIKIRTQFSQQNNDMIEGAYFDKNSLIYLNNGYARRSKTLNNNQFFDVGMDFQKDFDLVSISSSVGHQYQSINIESLQAAGGDFLTDVFSFHNLGAAKDITNGLATLNSGQENQKISSFYAQGNAVFKNTYSFNAAVRQEGASRLGVNNKWNTFYSIGTNILLSNLISTQFLSELIVGVQYGMSGLIPRQNLLSQELYALGNSTFYNGNFIPMLMPSSIANPDLRVELQKEFNFNMAFSSKSNKLRGNLDVFSQTNEDLLLETRSEQTDFLALWTNSASLKSSGFELSLNYEWVNNDKIQWQTDMNLSSASTKVDKVELEGFNTNNNINLCCGGLTALSSPRLVEGEALDAIRGQQYVRVNPDGQWEFKDTDANGFIDENDFTQIGDALPDAILNINTYLKIGNCDINLTLNGAFGHSIINGYRLFYESPFLLPNYNVINSAITSPTRRLTGGNEISDFYIDKASFINLQNLAFGYSIEKKGLYSRFYVVVQNLLTFTGYDGLDSSPRLSYQGIETAMGLEHRDTYLPTRTVTLGVQLSFE